MTTLTLRELNRATLARQMLLERAALAAPAAISRLVGLQAQLARAPYIGLWTRLHDFRRDDLAQAIQERTLVKATLMRATLHLCAVDDFPLLHSTVQPALDQASADIVRRRGADFNHEQILSLARDFLAERPRPFAAISAMLSEALPDADVGSMRYTVRTQLPLVQAHDDSAWSYPGNPQFTLIDRWLGQHVPAQPDLRELVMRYLAAFGPATVADIQKWSGLGKLKAAVDKFKSDLAIYRDEQGRELLDAPDMPLPSADTPAPVRFLPEFDNLLLAHDRRTRIIADEYRSRVFLPGLRVRATFLVDGFARGGWSVEVKKGMASLLIEPFAPLDSADRAVLIDEADRLARFVEPDAGAYAVRIAD